jgi:polyhydroxybutyrate depolymerase
MFGQAEGGRADWRQILLLGLFGCGDPIDRANDNTASTPDTANTTDTWNSTDTGDTVTPTCSPTVWSTGRHTLDHGGVQRTFQVYLPSSYDPSVPAPLVLAFHGWGGDGGEFLGDATVTAEADARSYILIAPDGLGPEESGRPASSWSFRGSTTGLDGDGLNGAVEGDSTDICDDDATTDYTYPSCEGVARNGCSWTQCSDDDVDFAVALVREASENLCVDLGRVYAVGGSNGGMFTWELGQNEASADTLRAIAPLIGLPHRGYLDPPSGPEGMPVLLVTGTCDRTVPPGEWEEDSFTTTSDGDVYYYTGATAITRVWAEAAGCSTTNAATPVDVGVPNLDCRSYCTDGDGLPPVLDCRAVMGHSYDFSWSWPLVLEFFEQHQ